jgi:DNA-binding NarL/FixJ family response regulator
MTFHSHSQPIRVLLVDDDPMVLSLVESFLDAVDSGLEVVTTPSPTDGLTRLERDGPAVDCIVSDYHMPDVDGIEFLALVRELDDTVPFVLYTSDPSEDLVTTAHERGATACIQKCGSPEHFESLAARISRLSARRQ